MKRRRGFSLIDLLFVLGIIGLLIAILVPAVQKVREGAARAATNNNLRQCAIAVHSHSADWKKVPPANGFFAATAKTGTCWGHLLPYIEQKPLWDGNKDFSGLTDFIPVYQAPNDPTATAMKGPVISFGANGAVFGLGARNIDGSMPDGTSNVIMFATVCQQCDGATSWAKGTRCIFGSQAANGVLTVDSAIPAFRVTSSKNCGKKFCGFGSVGISVAMGDHVVKVISEAQAKKGWPAGMHPDDKVNPAFD